MLGIPGSMNNEKGQVTTGLHASQRWEAGRQPSVNGDHASEALGVAQTEAVGDRCSFSAADEEDPFRMDVEQAAGFSDRREDAILETVKVVRLGIKESAADSLGLGTSRPRSQGGAVMKLEIPAPAETGKQIPLDHWLGAPQTKTDVVPPAQGGHRSNQLVFVPPPCMKEHQQGIGVIRFILPWDEPSFHQQAGCGRR